MTDLRRQALAGARRRVARFDLANRYLPWPLWCVLAASNSLTVAWVVGKRAGRPLTFLQVGANDGVIHDPLHAVVRAGGWAGVLVEPVPAMYERLVANYAGVPNLVFENAAIGPANGTTTLYSVESRPGDPYWVELIATFDRATILSHADVLTEVDQRIVEATVPSFTLSTLVARHQLDRIDLLQVDVEGYDYEVLKQIDFSTSWAPTFVVYEREHLDAKTDRAARRLLRSAGYHWVDIWPDGFAYRAAPETLGGTHARRVSQRPA